MGLSISKRVSAIEPSATLAIDAQAKALKANGIDVVGFGAGEPDFDTPEHIRAAAIHALNNGATRYTPSGGMPALKDAIIKKLLRDNELTYTPGQIIASNGAKHSLYNVFQALINPGDEVLLPTPCWVSYPELIRAAAGIPVFVPGHEDDHFCVSAEQLAPYVTEKTKAMILNSPNNPNGCVWDVHLLRGIANLAVAKQFYVVSDEIYENLIYDGIKHTSIASLGADIYAQTIVVNGVSKSYAMTGWRIGYAAGPENVIKAMDNYQSHATSNPNTIAQHAAIEALSGKQDTVEAMRRQFEARRDYIVERINAIPGLTCSKPSGAFYVMMNIGGILGRHAGDEIVKGSMDFARLLLEKANVAAVPGAPFMADNYMRLSYAISQDAIKKGMDRIAAFVGGLE